MITVVLDDDPTGTQSMSDVSVVLEWSVEDVWSAVRAEDRAVHVLTNSRAHSATQAGELVAAAATAARAALPGSRIILRGDSTLRAHVWEEYAALRSVIAPASGATPLLLVPALPAAGRVTIGGVQMLERDGKRVRLDQTEYAGDGVLRYTSSRLSEWAQERSGGRFDAGDAVTIGLEARRAGDGAQAVCEAIERAGALDRPAVVVPDAENGEDLSVIAAGLRRSEARGARSITRCAPAFVAALTSTPTPQPPPAPAPGAGVLVICGSFVPLSSVQIGRLAGQHPGAIVAAHVAALAGPDAACEVKRVSALARERIAAGGLAVVVTDRERDPALVAVEAQQRVAGALAQVAAGVPAGVVIAKGGITSAVTARDGLHARSARVLGPLLPGVALWRLDVGVDYLVVPGNVGGPDLLVDLVAAITR